MSKATNELEHEHEAILVALNILDSMQSQIANGEDVSINDIAAYLGFLKEFADKCHHGKEEGFLFPALVKAGLPEHEGPIAVMLSEHAQGRKLIHDMEMAKSPILRKNDFITAAKTYSRLMRHHIESENKHLFPTADRMLTQEQLTKLADEYEAFEHTAIGQGRHEQLHSLLKSLKVKFSH